MSWACGGRCACTEAGRSLLEPYGMASPRQPDPSAGLPSDLEKSGPPTARRRTRTASQRRQMLPLQASIPTIQAFLIAIFFALFGAGSVFGSVAVSTPVLEFASILSASTPSGTPNERWNEP